MHSMRIAAPSVGVDKWDSLDDIERQLLTYIVNHGATGRAKLEKLTGKSHNTVVRRMNHLMELELVKANGSKSDPNRTYESIIK